MRNYSQLTLEQRYGIYSLLKTGHAQSEIALTIGVHKSTISRELKRNRGKRGYRYKQAHTKAEDRGQGKISPRIDGSTWAFIESLIQKEWFPEQIHSWMKENMAMSVSHEWIYHYILQDKHTGGDLYTHLPRFIGGRKEGSVMGLLTDGGVSKTRSVLSKGLMWLKNEVE